MLQFLVAEPDQRLERDLVAEPMIAAQLQNLGVDVALDEPEHVGVGASLHLAEVPFLVRREGIEPVGHGQPIGQEFPGEVEPAATNDISFDVPANPLRSGDAACEPLTRNGFHAEISRLREATLACGAGKIGIDRLRRRVSGRGKLSTERG